MLGLSLFLFKRKVSVGPHEPSLTRFERAGDMAQGDHVSCGLPDPSWSEPESQPHSQHGDSLFHAGLCSKCPALASVWE